MLTPSVRSCSMLAAALFASVALTAAIVILAGGNDLGRGLCEIVVDRQLRLSLNEVSARRHQTCDSPNIGLYLFNFWFGHKR